MIIKYPRIIDIIQESSLRDHDKEMLLAHLDTIDAYVGSLHATLQAQNGTRDYVEIKARDITEKTVYINALMHKLYSKLDDKEIAELRQEVESCLTQTKETT